MRSRDRRAIRVAWTLLLLPLLCASGESPGPSDRLGARALLARYPAELGEELFAKNLVVIPPHAGGENPPGLSAMVLFEKPASRVMRLLSQTARQKEFRPELSQLERISEQDGWLIDEHQIKILFLKIVYRVRSEIDFQQRRIEWQLDESVDNDLKTLWGFWQLHELGEDRSVGHFGGTTEIGNLVPKLLGNAITRRKVPSMLENCRRWVNSDGRYRP